MMKNIEKLNKFLKLALLIWASIYSSAAISHVRWFAPQNLEPISFSYDYVLLTLTTFVLCCLVIAVYIQFFLARLNVVNKLMFSAPPFPYKWLWYLLLGLINLFMIINLLYGEFLAPNLVLPLEAIVWGVIVQAAIVIVMPWSVSLVGFFITILTGLLFSMFPPEIVLDYVFEFAGIGIALILVGPSLNKNDQRIATFLRLDSNRIRRDGLIVLRLALGAQLIELAVQNKLMRPESALWFIENNSFYNFFPTIGLSQVSNLHFVYFVGISELVLGILLIFNVSRRLVLVTTALAFIMTGFISGGHELTGHIPIFGVILVLLAEPVGNRIKSVSFSAPAKNAGPMLNLSQ